jgi:signal transduction histidine kinase
MVTVESFDCVGRREEIAAASVVGDGHATNAPATPAGVHARCARGVTSPRRLVPTLCPVRAVAATTSPDAARPPVAREVLIVAVVALIQIGVTTLTAQHQDPSEVGVVGYVLLGAGVLVLPLRWRFPVAVLATTFGTTLAYWSLGYPRGPVFASLVVAFAHAVLTRHRTAAVVSLVVGYPCFLWLGAALDRTDAPSVAGAVGLAAWLVALLCIVEVARVRRARAADIARSRDEAIRRQAADERLRIARDLHDVVAHNLSLVNLQAGVALHLFDERPEEARNALRAIRDASKEALAETRGILDVLRRPGEAAPRAPTPGLGDLDDLVSRAGEAGLDVRVETDGDLAHLGRDVELAAYRIIQESLTNVARHSDRRDATVRLHMDDGVLTVEVLDEGSGRPVAPRLADGGSGIAGMRERAISVGGELEAGPRSGRGFAVRARLPVGAAS